MNNKQDTAAVLASLSAIKQDHNIVLSDEEIAGFIDNKLTPEQEQKVIDALAVNPNLLAEVVETYETRHVFDSHLATLRAQKDKGTTGQPKGSISLVQQIANWFSSNWIPSTSMGGLVAAAFAYVILIPSMSINDISESISQGYGLTSLDEASLPKSLTTKGFKFNQSNDQIDFEFGQSIALAKLTETINSENGRECTSKEDCLRSNVFVLLGQWQTLSAAQCDSEYSVDTTFWARQAEAYNGLRDFIGDYQVTLPELTGNSEQSVCSLINNSNWRF
jgi:hypothetical protein